MMMIDDDFLLPVCLSVCLLVPLLFLAPASPAFAAPRRRRYWLPRSAATRRLPPPPPPPSPAVLRQRQQQAEPSKAREGRQSHAPPGQRDEDDRGGNPSAIDPDAMDSTRFDSYGSAIHNTQHRNNSERQSEKMINRPKTLVLREQKHLEASIDARVLSLKAAASLNHRSSLPSNIHMTVVPRRHAFPSYTSTYIECPDDQNTKRGNREAEAEAVAEFLFDISSRRKYNE